MRTKTAEFELHDLLGICMTFVVIGIGLTYGLSVQSDVKDSIVANYAVTATCNASGTGIVSGCGADVNASLDSMTANSKIASKLPMIATVIIAALIIGIVVRYLVVQSGY